MFLEKLLAEASDDVCKSEKFIDAIGFMQKMERHPNGQPMIAVPQGTRSRIRQRTALATSR